MSEAESAICYLERVDGQRLAFSHLAGRSPGVIFCPGFNSNMHGTKALALEAFCRERGQQYTRFDYFGHGLSSGNFVEGTVGRWKDDAIAVLDGVATGTQVIVGSSMGAWIMLLMALARPARIHALIGIAAAPDFTAHRMSGFFTTAQLADLDELGYCDLPNCYDDGEPYRITRRLLEEGNEHLVLDAAIPLEVPVRLIHAMDDPDSPWQRSMLLLERLNASDVELQLLKTGGHRLSEPADLDRMLARLELLLAG